MTITFVPGENCDILLRHKDVESGDFLPFRLVDIEGGSSDVAGGVRVGGSVTVARSAEKREDGTIRIDGVFYFTVRVGSTRSRQGHAWSRSEADGLEFIFNLLSQQEGLELVCRHGAFGGLGVVGHHATVIEYPDWTLVSVRLEVKNMAWLPAEYETFALSAWVNENDLPGEYSKWFDEDSDTVKGYWR